MKLKTQKIISIGPVKSFETAKNSQFVRNLETRMKCDACNEDLGVAVEQKKQ